MTCPRLSILLPTWNGERDLQRLLPALAMQSLADECEILAIDSSSSDGTLRELEAAGAQVEVIAQEDFGHGRTRNRLAQKARGEVLVFLSQDVQPVGKEFLRELIAPLERDGVAGSYARILPYPTDDALTARTVLQAPEAASEAPQLAELDAQDVWKLPGTERAEYLRFNNVASCVRAEVFREIDFPEVPFGEDFAWAARALGAGWRVQFAPRSVAFHAHRYNARQAFERYRIDAAFHLAIHDHRLRTGVVSVLRGVLFEIAADMRFVASQEGYSWGDLWRAPALRSAQVLGQFWGSRGWGKEFWPEEHEPTAGTGR